MPTVLAIDQPVGQCPKDTHLTLVGIEVTSISRKKFAIFIYSVLLSRYRFRDVIKGLPKDSLERH